MMPSIIALRAQRGAAALNVVLVVVLIAGIAAAGWYFTQREEAAVAPTSVAPAAAVDDAAVAPEEVVTIAPEVEVLTVGQLFTAARTALAEQRMVMPAGNNALEYYLAILEKEPGNSGASEALRELFPFASGTAEQEIASGSLDEAARIIAQLAKADPENYTLTILRGKLEARRTVLERELATQAAATSAAAAARTAAPAASSTPPPPAAATPEPQPAVPVATEVVESPPVTPAPPPAAAAPPPVVATPPRPVATQPSAAGSNSDVSITSAAALSYPQQAARNRVEGWVEVEFTVTADGQVQGARVLRSDPPRVFDREAVRSIERSTFRARVENGTPVNSTLRRRIEFKLDS